MESIEDEVMKLRTYLSIVLGSGVQCNNTFYLTKLYLEVILKIKSSGVINYLIGKGINCDCEVIKKL